MHFEIDLRSIAHGNLNLVFLKLGFWRSQLLQLQCHASVKGRSERNIIAVVDRWGWVGFDELMKVSRGSLGICRAVVDSSSVKSMT